MSIPKIILKSKLDYIAATSGIYMPNSKKHNGLSYRECQVIELIWRLGKPEDNYQVTASIRKKIKFSFKFESIQTVYNILYGLKKKKVLTHDMKLNRLYSEAPAVYIQLTENNQ